MRRRKVSNTNYPSDIRLNEKYRDDQTGFEGIATSVTFFQHACERVGLETYDAERKKVITEIFDAPRLTHVETGKTAKVELPGGPGDMNAQRGANIR